MPVRGETLRAEVGRCGGGGLGRGEVGLGCGVRWSCVTLGWRRVGVGGVGWGRVRWGGVGWGGVRVCGMFERGGGGGMPAGLGWGLDGVG